MKLFDFPFYIVLISIILPLASAFLWIEMHRIILVFCVYVFIFLLLSEKHEYKFSKSSIIILASFILLFVCDKLFGRGLFYFSNSHIVIYTFVFYNCFLIGERGIADEVRLIKQIDKIYHLIIIFMLLELAIQLSGSKLLYSLFSLSKSGDFDSVIETYLEYHNRFATAVGLKITALNSVILGNQIAGQLNLYAMVWFLPFYYKFKDHCFTFNRKIWFSLSMILFIISPTMTSSILLIICLAVLLFYLPISKLNNIKSRLIISSITIIFSGILLKYLFPLIFNEQFSLSEYSTFISPEGHEFSALNYYLYGMIYPIFYYMDLNTVDQIFGIMNPGSLWAELGFAKLLITNGALWLFLLFVPIILVIHSSFRLSKNVNFKTESSFTYLELIKKWIWFAQVNGFICLIHVLSLIHYIVIFRLGAIQLFAFHLSITIFAVRKVKLLKNKS